MNVQALREKLLAAARNTPLDERVPYAFEKRVMARLAASAAIDPWMLWSRALSRAAICCVLFSLLLGLGSSLYRPASAPHDLSQDVDQALFAAAVSPVDL